MICSRCMRYLSGSAGLWRPGDGSAGCCGKEDSKLCRYFLPRRADQREHKWQ